LLVGFLLEEKPVKLANLISDNPPRPLSTLTSGYVIASVCCHNRLRNDSGYRILISKYHPETDESCFLFEVKIEDIYDFATIFERLNALLFNGDIVACDGLISTNE
jgi:hypothetical protein